MQGSNARLMQGWMQPKGPSLLAYARNARVEFSLRQIHESMQQLKFGLFFYKELEEGCIPCISLRKAWSTGAVENLREALRSFLTRNREMKIRDFFKAHIPLFWRKIVCRQDVQIVLLYQRYIDAKARPSAATGDC